MACTGKQRFDALNKELTDEERSLLNADDIVIIKEDLGKGLRPEFHPDKYNLSTSLDELGITELYSDLTPAKQRGKRTAFINAIDKINKGEKPNKNQQTTYDEITAYLSKEEDTESKWLKRFRANKETSPGKQKSGNPVLNARVKDSVKNSNHFQKDINMGEVSTQFIGEGAKEGVASSTNAYRDAWGDKANTGDYTSSDTVMVSGSGPWRGVTFTDINRKFESFYKPLLSKAIEAGSKIVVGNAKGIDQLVVKYLKANGYDVKWNSNKNHWEGSNDNDSNQDPEDPIEPQDIDDRYLLQGKFEAGEDQKKVIDEGEKFLDDQKYAKKLGENILILQGKGGTGKTSVISRIIINYLKKQSNPAKTRVAMMTISHEAKNVLASMSKDIKDQTGVNANVTTLMSGMAWYAKPQDQVKKTKYETAQRPSVLDFDGYEIKYSNKDAKSGEMFPSTASTLEKGDILVIDEASMLPRDMYAYVLELSQSGVKAIMMGDYHQALPVNDNSNVVGLKNNSKFSPALVVFTDNSEDNKAVNELRKNAKILELNKIFRQEEDSSILDYADYYASKIERNLGKRKDLAKKPQSNGKDTFNVKKTHSVSLLSKLINKGLSAIAIFYTNNDVSRFNTAIRKKLFNTSTPSEYMVGDVLVAYDTAGKFTNSQRLTIEKIDVGSEVDADGMETALVPIDIGQETYEVEYKDGTRFTKLQLKDNRTGEKSEMYVPQGLLYRVSLIAAQSSKRFDAIYEEELAKLLKLKGKPNLGKARSRMAEIVKDMDTGSKLGYGYAITAHKSQGNTYDVTVVDLSHKRMDDNTKYTAVTRASKAMYIIDENETEGVLNVPSSEPVTPAKEEVAVSNKNNDDAGTKGSSSNNKKEPVITLMNELLDDTNLMDTFEKVYEMDVENGKEVELTQDYIDHITNVFDMLGDVMKTHGDKVNMTIGEDDSGETHGFWTPVYDIATKKSSDTVEVLYDPADQTSSASEVMLHELLHSLFNKAFDANRSVRKKMEALRREFKDNFDQYIFTEQMEAEGATELNEDDMAKLKRKWDYIMSDAADIEEFAAYIMSNSYLYNRVMKLEVAPQKQEMLKVAEGMKARLRSAKGANKIFATFNVMIDLAKAMLVDLLGALNGKNKYAGKTGEELITETLQEIHAFQIKGEFRTSPETFTDVMRGYVEDKGAFVAGSLETAAVVIDSLGKVSEPIKKAVLKVFEVKDKVLDKIDPNNNNAVAGAIAGIEKISFAKKILNLRLFKNVMFQNFTTNKYQALLQLKRQKQRVEAMMTNINTEVTNAIGKTEAMDPSNTYLAHVFTNKMLKSEIYKYKDKLSFDSMSLRSQTKRLASEALTKLTEEHFDLNAEDIKHLDAIAKWTLDGKVHIENQQHNPQNVLNRFYSSLKKTRKGKLNTTKIAIEAAEEYIAMKAASLMTDDELDAIEEIHSNVKLEDELYQVAKLYTNGVNKLKYRDMDPQNYNSIPFGYIDYKTGSAKYQISLVHENDIKSFKGKFGEVKILDEFTIDNETIYRVKHVEDASPYEDGVLSSIAISVKGNGIRGLIQGIYLQRKRNNDTEAVDMTSEEFTAKMLRSMLDKDTRFFSSKDGLVLMPKYGNDGKIVDWILPLTSDDMKEMEVNVDMMSALPYTIERMENMKRSDLHNQNAIDTIEKFYMDKKYDKDYRKNKFLTISSERNTHIWDKLSPTIKSYIEAQHDGVIHMPDEILELLVGVRAASVSNIKMTDINPFSKDKDDLLFKSHNIRKAIRTAEKVWSEILSRNKTVAILFNPAIMVGNFISNMMLMWSHGVNPYRYIKEFRNKWDLLEEYEKLDKKKASLSVQDVLGMDVDNELRIVTEQINSHPFRSLVKDGQFTMMIEDMSKEPEGYLDNLINDLTEKGKNDREYYTQVVVEAYKRKAEAGESRDIDSIIREVERELKRNKWKFRIPAELAQLRKTLYGTEGTDAHKVATKVTMYADTLARQMLLEKMTADKERGLKRRITKDEEQEILDFVDEQFINYGYNVSGAQMWAEKVLGVHFLKYLFQHHKAYMKVLKRNPHRVVAQQAAQHATGINVADPMDTLADHGPIDNIVNRWRSDDPIDVIGELVSTNMGMPLGIFDVDNWARVYH